MILEYIKKAIPEKNKQSIVEITNNCQMTIVHSLPEFFNINYIVDYVKKNIPPRYFNAIDGIYVAHIKEFEQREINAIFKDNAIYVTNRQESESDFLDDVVHELGHALEERYYNLIYGDKTLEGEFIEKRYNLYQTLSNKGLNFNKQLYNKFHSPDYDEEIDELFYHHIGYDKLEAFTQDLFYSPYAATSLREYFANGFEHYYLAGKERLEVVCPNLFNRIKDLEMEVTGQNV